MDSSVVPGDILTPAFTNNLKLGPGLFQTQNSDGHSAIVTTRAGVLRSGGRNKYFVESNGQRVCRILGYFYDLFPILVRPRPSRIRGGSCHGASWRGISCGYWLCTFSYSRCSCFRRSLKTKPPKSQGTISSPSNIDNKQRNLGWILDLRTCFISP